MNPSASENPTALASRGFALFIDGEWVPAVSGETRPVLNPSDGAAFTRVADGTEADVLRAIASADKAFPVWRDTLPAQRCAILNRIAVRLRENTEELAVLEMLNTGKPIGTARSAVSRIARYFEFFAGAADKIHGETYPLGPDYHCYSRREPFGVTAHILPWNAPLQQAVRGIAPALAAGNTVVAKPSEFTPVTCLKLAELAHECGLPPGVWNVVCGDGGSVGSTLVSDPRVRLIAFTGSVNTGRRILSLAAERVVPVIPELGGKSSNIVFEDADLVAAAKGAVTAFTANSGQLCSAGTRLLVHESIHDDVVERVSALVRSLRVGPGEENPDMGPIITRPQYDRVLNYIAIGQAEGARLACGGTTPGHLAKTNGYFIEPTVFSGVHNDMRIAREEIFGPVLCVIPFQSDQQAVAIANDSPFGLVAGLWTANLARAHRVAGALEAGQVYVNEYFAGDVETPFGGVKQSGYGRERGLEALRTYTQLKTVNVRL